MRCPDALQHAPPVHASAQLGWERRTKRTVKLPCSAVMTSGTLGALAPFKPLPIVCKHFISPTPWLHISCSVKDLLTVHRLTGIPIVFDFHHHGFCTGGWTEEQAFRAAIATWPQVRAGVQVAWPRVCSWVCTLPRCSFLTGVDLVAPCHFAALALTPSAPGAASAGRAADGALERVVG